MNFHLDIYPTIMQYLDNYTYHSMVQSCRYIRNLHLNGITKEPRRNIVIIPFDSDTYSYNAFAKGKTFNFARFKNAIDYLNTKQCDICLIVKGRKITNSAIFFNGCFFSLEEYEHKKERYPVISSYYCCHFLSNWWELMSLYKTKMRVSIDLRKILYREEPRIQDYANYYAPVPTGQTHVLYHITINISQERLKTIKTAEDILDSYCTVSIKQIKNHHLKINLN